MSFRLTVRLSVFPHCSNTAPTWWIFVKTDIGEFQLRKCIETLNFSLKLEKKILDTLPENPSMFYRVFLAATHVEQQHGEIIAVLQWQSFHCLLRCWQHLAYINNEKGTHFNVSVSKVITRTRHYITLYVHCLLWYLVLTYDRPETSMRIS